MKIAFVILAHKYPEQIIRLVKALSSEGDHFFIHIDQRATSVFSDVEKLLGNTSHVFLMDQRDACRWGQFSIVNATLNCLRRACLTQENYDYVFLISGQDYPIRPLSEIKRFLEENRGQQFIEAFPLAEPNKWTNAGGAYQAMKRVSNWHFFLRSRPFHVPLQRKLPNALVPYGGSQWWALTGEFVQWMINYLNTHPNVITYFKYTFIPDEMFFQTLVCNSPFKEAVANYSLTYTDWSNPNPTPPRVLTMEDVDALKISDLLFARKFEPGRSDEVLDLIDQLL
ncbi:MULTISPECIES: beta-1,6-N-acetylglucosaminyltransferase [unclassified Leptolyngbya]|uniref:beta-1,6-N-acetylglucosaminyltransferase n=1 Tax=unclassified Leptolyngbya TaxID=2650499 RepID=UPI001689B82C|nr:MULTISPECIES: beta-1,6-N-acetylglucosaminyltransferase [unclassified Leptolyngbya]MBD1912939.1 hypothetical protein [Leptolyngbya sp. FACHB-8]MBD2154732.1 hypothetical protein [Leptolyngbya sp. FACHB-16]